MMAAHRLVLVAAMPPGMAREAALERRLADASLDWNTVEQCAVDWGLAPLVGRGLAGHAARVPEALRARCSGIERLTAVRNSLLLHHARGVGALSADLDVPIIALKGVDLMGRVYPHAGCRITTDLDILAPVADIDRVEARLAAAGWRPPPGMDRGWFDRHLHHGHPWLSPDGAVALELHWALVRPDDPFDLPATDVWTRRVAVPELGRTAARLGDDDQVIFLVAHALRHLDAPEGVFRSLIDLVWVVEARPHDAGTTDLITLARRSGLDRLVRAALRWRSGLLECVPDALECSFAAGLERDPLVDEALALLDRAAGIPAHRPLAVASGLTGLVQRRGVERWRFLARGVAPRPRDMTRDLTSEQAARPLPFRYLALALNYWNEARRLGLAGFKAAAATGRFRRRLAESRGAASTAAPPPAPSGPDPGPGGPDRSD